MYDISNMRKSLELILGQNVQLMSTTKLPNMKLRLALSAEIDKILYSSGKLKLLVLIYMEGRK